MTATAIDTTEAPALTTPPAHGEAHQRVRLPPPSTIAGLLSACAGTAAIHLAFLASPLRGLVAVLIALVAALFILAMN